MATILTFTTPGDPRRAAPRPDARAEVIVFPRTDVQALRRALEMHLEPPPCSDGPATAPNADSDA